jgi:antirestriction protein ArdC
MANKVYEMITDTIVRKLEQGVVPWRKTWQGGGMAPRSLASKKPYRGINVFLLGMQGYASPFWATFNQVKKQGGKVKAGEKGTVIVFWKWVNKKDEDGNETDEKMPFLRYFKVWNTDQCTGLKVPDFGAPKPIDFNPIIEAEKVWGAWQNKPTIQHCEAAAWYKPPADLINMPKPETFETPEAYYHTLFHEAGHATGHSSRLNRPEIQKRPVFGDSDYSLEELVAEMTAAMVCGSIGIGETTIDNAASYIQHWLRKLKDDPKMLVMAGGRAQKAADHILGDYGEPDEPEDGE